MFTLTESPGKFVILLILFAFCILWETVELGRAKTVPQRVSVGLHWVMAVVMFLMIPGPTWQALIAVIPIPALTVLFGLAAVWFTVRLVIDVRREGTAHLGHALSHTVMFWTMTWHLGAMAVHRSLRTASSSAMTTGHNHGGHGMAHGHGHGTAMSAMQQAAAPGGTLWVLALIGIFLLGFLLWASIRDLIAAVRGIPGASHATVDAAEGGRGTLYYRLSALSSFAMNFGMVLMSLGLLAPIVPVLGRLNF